MILYRQPSVGIHATHTWYMIPTLHIVLHATHTCTCICGPNKKLHATHTWYMSSILTVPSTYNVITQSIHKEPHDRSGSFPPCGICKSCSLTWACSARYKRGGKTSATHDWTHCKSMYKHQSDTG